MGDEKTFLDVSRLLGDLSRKLVVSCDSEVSLSRDQLMDVIDALGHMREQGIDYVPSTREV